MQHTRCVLFIAKLIPPVFLFFALRFISFDNLQKFANLQEFVEWRFLQDHTHTHTHIHSIYEEVPDDSQERSLCAHMPARFRSQKGVFRGETVVSYNPWRHIIYIKLADKFSLARWPYPRRAGTFEGISLIGHKIGTEDPLTSCAGRMAHKAP